MMKCQLICLEGKIMLIYLHKINFFVLSILRRVMTANEFKKRKKVMTKYQRELLKEREEEKFYCEVFDER